jgi:peptidoglycan LD-endopeptidase LytH
VSKRTRWLLLPMVAVLLSLGVCLTGRAGLLLACARECRPRTTLEIPVEGLPRSALVSQWHAPRSGGRRHQGVDLFADRGTNVISATRGRVWKVGTDALGGRVVTVLGDGPAFYYYAHLDGFAEGLKVGQRVLPGTPLGTVGNTGNARTTPPHLHFGVYEVGAWRTRAVDPVPLLKRTRPVATRRAPDVEGPL